MGELFTHLSAHFPTGFTGIVGANGAGKTTLLRLMIGELAPSSGLIEGVTNALYCAQRTDHAPETFKDFLEDWDGCPCALLLVSHDRRFINNVGAQTWTINVDDQGNSTLITQ